jgi:hypothetical protein
MIHIPRTGVLLLLTICVSGPSLGQDDEAVVPLIVRHEHYFVVINTADTAPTITAQSKGFYTYTDRLRLQILDDASMERFASGVGVGGRLEIAIPGPVAPLYLVFAAPGINGVTIEADRPWGVVAGGGHPLGSNGTVPEMYLYVPGDCLTFDVTVQANSPREGARVSVIDPQGSVRLTMDGEFDAADTETVWVPDHINAGIWSIKWDKPQTVEAGLDDATFSIDGELAPLLWPRKEWAQQHGDAIWDRHREALAEMEAADDE